MLEKNGRAPAVSRVRAIVVAAIGLLAIGQVVRFAYVAAYASDQPLKAASVWPSHPDVLFKTALDRIVRAAVAGQPVPRSELDAIYSAAADAPLAPEPYLVRGVDAQTTGNAGLAQRALEAARRRNPRSLAAHYFLADHYLRTNQPDAGLVELARLTRLLPTSIATVAPYYARYAREPGGAARVKAMLRAHPEFEPDVLSALANDAANADLILFLASGRGQSTGDPPAWHGQLVQSLVEASQYAKARAIWSKLSGEPVAADPGLFDPQFSGKKAPPPFNWSLLSNASGLAEEQGEGRLHLIYYGRDNVTLASQTLTLSPGRYRLSFKVEGSSKNLPALAWTISCLPSKRAISSFALGRQAGQTASDFSIGADCPAQLLALTGTSPEFPETVDVTLSGLSLTKVAS
jgi:hypothetical protein